MTSSISAACNGGTATAGRALWIEGHAGKCECEFCIGRRGETRWLLN
jgi:hypothetical protein